MVAAEAQDNKSLTDYQLLQRPSSLFSVDSRLLFSVLFYSHRLAFDRWPFDRRHVLSLVTGKLD